MGRCWLTGFLDSSSKLRTLCPARAWKRHREKDIVSFAILYVAFYATQLKAQIQSVMLNKEAGTDYGSFKIPK